MSAVPNEAIRDKLLLSVSEAAGLLGIGRTKVYELMAAGELRPVHIGRLCRLPVDEVLGYVGRLCAGDFA